MRYEADPAFRRLGVLCVAATCLLLQSVAPGQFGAAGVTSTETDSTSTTPRLYPVKREKKIGYIDASGRLAIPFRFDRAAPFSEDRAYVQFQGKCGYIDAGGSVVFAEERFCSHMVREFHEGLAGFEFKFRGSAEDYARHRKRGYLGTNGDIVIPPRFFNNGDFHEGVAAVNEAADSKFGYIDKTGQYAISPRFDYASDFSEELAAVVVRKKTGYIDHGGRFVIQPQFDEYMGGAFHDGIALVGLKGKLGAIDRAGRFVVPPGRGTARDCSEGLIPFKGQRGRVRYYDVQGNVVIEGEYDDYRPFSEGFAAVAIHYKWGYINRQGKPVIPLQFDEAFDFRGGLAKVYSAAESDWAYIDTQGRVVWRGVPG